MQAKPIRIILADDHYLFRKGIIELLKNSLNLEVVDDVKDGKELVKSFVKNKPDLIIIDISMPEMTGLQAFDKLKQIDPNVKALFLSMHTEDIYYHQICSIGGKGLIDKNIQVDELEYAIDEIMNGRLYFKKKILKNNADKATNFQLYESRTKYGSIEITNREYEVLELIKDCLSSDQIADKLSLSVRTVEKHRENIIRKAKLKNYLQLFRFAQEYVIERETLIIK